MLQSKKPSAKELEHREQMACYLCFGTRSSGILLETSLAALKGDLKFLLDVIQYLCSFFFFFFEIDPSEHHLISALAVISQLSYQHMGTVERENAFQHHPQSLGKSPVTDRILSTHLDDKFIKAVALKMLEMTKVVIHTPPLQHSKRAGSLCNTNSAREKSQSSTNLY